MNLIFRPLTQWTDPQTRNRKPARFTATWHETLELLDHEVDTLVNGNKFDTEVIIEVMAKEGNMRRDGGLRADAKVEHPGVVISFEGPTGPLRFACDRFSAGSIWSGGVSRSIPAWQMNARAIAKGLEALRMIDRYGIASSNEQYRGFTAIGAGMPMPAATTTMTKMEAATILLEAAGMKSNPNTQHLVMSRPEEAKRVYRYAVLNAHPDHGGTNAKFIQVEQAMEVLKR